MKLHYRKGKVHHKARARKLTRHKPAKSRSLRNRRSGR